VFMFFTFTMQRSKRKVPHFPDTGTTLGCEISLAFRLFTPLKFPEVN